KARSLSGDGRDSRAPAVCAEGLFWVMRPLKRGRLGCGRRVGAARTGEVHETGLPLLEEPGLAVRFAGRECAPTVGCLLPLLPSNRGELFCWAVTSPLSIILCSFRATAASRHGSRRHDAHWTSGTEWSQVLTNKTSSRFRAYDFLDNRAPVVTPF